MAIAKSELSSSEKTQLRKLETVIKKGQRAFCDTAKAVLEIEDGKLFRENHASISAYCAGVWDMSAPEVSRLRKAARVLAALEAGGFDKLPVCESQALALAGLRKKDDRGKLVLDSDKVTKAWKAVVDKGGKITADLIGEVVKELFGEVKKPDAKPQQVAIDFQPVIADLHKLDQAIAQPNKLTPKDKECLRAQVVAAEKLLAEIKRHLG